MKHPYATVDLISSLGLTGISSVVPEKQTAYLSSRFDSSCLTYYKTNINFQHAQAYNFMSISFYLPIYACISYMKHCGGLKKTWAP